MTIIRMHNERIPVKPDLMRPNPQFGLTTEVSYSIVHHGGMCSLIVRASAKADRKDVMQLPNAKHLVWSIDEFVRRKAAEIQADWSFIVMTWKYPDRVGVLFRRVTDPHLTAGRRTSRAEFTLLTGEPS